MRLGALALHVTDVLVESFVLTVLNHTFILIHAIGTLARR